MVNDLESKTNNFDFREFIPGFIGFYFALKNRMTEKPTIVSNLKPYSLIFNCYVLYQAAPYIAVLEFLGRK